MSSDFSSSALSSAPAADAAGETVAETAVSSLDGLSSFITEGVDALVELLKALTGLAGVLG